MDIRASLTRILSGDDVRISWTAENVRNVEVDGVAVTGTSGFEDENPTRTERYEITAEDLLGRAVSDDVTVTVAGGQPDLDIRASLTRILSGDDVRISWTAENVRNVEVDGVAVTGTSGFEDENPTRTERYEITGGGPAGPGGVGRRHGHRGRGPAGSGHPGEPDPDPVGRRRPDQLDGGERPERGGRRVAVTGTSGFEDERPTRTERYEITAEDLLGRGGVGRRDGHRGRGPAGRGHPGEPDPDPVGRRRPDQLDGGERPERGRSTGWR